MAIRRAAVDASPPSGPSRSTSSRRPCRWSMVRRRAVAVADRRASCHGCWPSPTRRAAWARPPPRSTWGPAWPTWATASLVVDLDPQGNASTGLGINVRDLDVSMYDVILHDAPIEDCIEATVGPQPVRGARQPRPGRRRDRAGPGLQPGAAAAPGARRGPRRLRLRPHRLPAVARPADGERPGRGLRGAGADPVRVLRPRGPGPAAAQRRPGAEEPEPGARAVDDRPGHVRRPHQAGRPGRRRGPRATSATRCAARSSPGPCGCPRRRRSASRSSRSIRPPGARSPTGSWPRR